jgi:hypothetical protein
MRRHWWKFVAVAVLLGAVAGFTGSRDEPIPAAASSDKARSAWDNRVDRSSIEMLADGRRIFRDDTFGSEDFWGGTLRLHEAILGEKLGGVGPGLSPKQALAAGLKVDANRLPRSVVEAIQAGKVDLDDPATTVELLRADAVLGVHGVFDAKKQLVSVGIACAFCHSTVDDRITQGIGSRLDGWPNRDLNVGAVVAMAPNLAPFADLLGVDEDTVRKVLNSWGPGRYDAELNHDGKAFRPDGATGATLLPAAFGLAGVNLHTYTGWGSVTHWNAYVANTQMHGKGTFYDPRLNDPERFPLAVKSGDWNTRNNPDLITSKLAALHYYQLSIPAPQPPAGSFHRDMATLGKVVFEGKGRCATCHVPPLFTEPGWNMHTAEEIGIDDFQASRSPEKTYYRTTPLKGLFAREKGGFYHDGRFATYGDVVDHYDQQFNLGLSADEKAELVEYLKSL